MIVSIINLKGGVGKSTITTNLAAAYAYDNKKVIIIDTDPQISTLRWSGERPEDQKQITVVSITDPNAIRKQVKNFISDYDVILLDGAPQIDQILATSIAVSNIVIIPVQPSPYDIWSSTENIAERIKNLQVNSPDIKAFFVVNRDNPRTNLSKDVIKTIEDLELPLLKTTLKNRVAYADSALNGLSVLEWEDQKAKDEILELYKEIKDITKNTL